MVDQTTPSSDVNAESAAVIGAAVPVNNVQTGKGLSVFAILLSLLAIGGGAYNFYLMQMAKQSDEVALVTGVTEIGSDVKVLAERMNQLQRSQQSVEQSAVSKEQLQTGLLQASNQTDLALRDIKQQQQGLTDTLSKLAANAERGADTLALTEVSQLLKLANNSAVFSGNRDGAINALKLADSQLKQLADPRYAVVRRAINEEISALDALVTVDVTSLTAKLSAAAKQVPLLPLENEPPVAGQVLVAEPEQTEDITFVSEMKQLWVMALNTVKIKRIDEPPKPLLAPEQRYFLDQNIQLKLNTAELAVMQNKPEVYRRNVEAALSWLLEYYDPRDDGVIKLADELRALKEQPLGIDLPSISGSYDQLQRIKGGN